MTSPYFWVNLDVSFADRLLESDILDLFANEELSEELLGSPSGSKLSSNSWTWPILSARISEFYNIDSSNLDWLTVRSCLYVIKLLKSSTNSLF